MADSRIGTLVGNKFPSNFQIHSCGCQAMTRPSYVLLPCNAHYIIGMKLGCWPRGTTKQDILEQAFEAFPNG